MMFLRSFFLFLSFHSFVYATARVDSMEPETPIKKGIALYHQGNFKDAASLLEKSLDVQDAYGQELYADICLRKLDGVAHQLMEAALYYISAARLGNQDVMSYLEDAVPGILSMEDGEEQLKSLVERWVKNRTADQLEPIKPQEVNDYLLSVGHKITITSAQKFPYFFDKVATSFFYDLKGSPPSFIDERAYFSFKQSSSSSSSREFLHSSCSAEALKDCHPTSSFLTETPIGKKYGPVYRDYYDSLNEKYDEEKRRKKMERDKEILLQKTDSPIKIHSLYKIILNEISAVLDKKTVSDLVSMTHRDHPWLLIGLGFWKEHYQKSAGTNGWTEEKILDHLRNFKKIPEEMVRKLEEKFENKRKDFRKNELIWSSKIDGRYQAKENHEYSALVQSFFASEISRNDPFVVRVRDALLRKTTHTLDCFLEDDLDILRVPIIMFYCTDLTLKNLVSTKDCYQSFAEGQRYFGHLETIQFRYAPDFDPKSKYGQRIQILINSLDTLQDENEPLEIV